MKSTPSQRLGQADGQTMSMMMDSMSYDSYQTNVTDSLAQRMKITSTTRSAPSPTLALGLTVYNIITFTPPSLRNQLVD